MKYRINCKHIESNCKCNSPYMKKKFWIFKRTCLVIDKIEKCWYRDPIVDNNGHINGNILFTKNLTNN